MTDFAPTYERNEDGYILFPRDIEWRRSLYPAEVFHHPAKMQMHLVKAVMEAYTKPGDKVLDPFGGTGTTALMVMSGRLVTLIELEPQFLEILLQTRRTWREQLPDLGNNLTILSGDSKQVMKSMESDAFDMVFTSPPYANLQVGNVQTEFTGQLAEEKARMMEYGSSAAHPQNFGRLNTFAFNLEMGKIYKETVRVLKPGGLYITVTKDQMRAGVRYHYSEDITRICKKNGLEPTGDWWKWAPPGSMLQSVMKSKGSEVVEDEDILVFRKPL